MDFIVTMNSIFITIYSFYLLMVAPVWNIINFGILIFNPSSLLSSLNYF